MKDGEQLSYQRQAWDALWRKLLLEPSNNSVSLQSEVETEAQGQIANASSPVEKN